MTNYLSAEAVAETYSSSDGSPLREARSSSPISMPVSWTAALRPDAARWIRNIQRAGEPWTFGLLPDRLSAFLGGLGHTFESDVSTRDAGDRWFPALGRRERGSALYHVAVARIG